MSVARVLQVLGSMERAGAETFVMNIYRELDRSRVQFDFLVHATKKCSYDDEILALGGRIFHHASPARDGFRAYGRKLEERLLGSGPFAAVHSHIHLFSGFVAAVAKRAGVPHRVAHAHTTSDGTHGLRRQVYTWYMKRLLQRNATEMLGCSRPTSEALFGKRCWADDRVSVVNNGIVAQSYLTLPDARSSICEELELPIDTVLMGHIGAMSTRKNQPFLLQLFALLRQREPNSILLLAGDGPLRDSVAENIRIAGLEKSVRLLGVRSDIPRIMAALDVLIFPSLWEGLPVTLIEAQAAGLPCVVSDSITRDVDLGLGLISFFPLASSLDNWAKEVFAAIRKRRPDPGDRLSAIRKHGYDSREVATKLTELYLRDGMKK